MLNNIFYDNEDYSKYVDYCNKNNYTIIEIEADEKGRRFKIVEKEKPTIKENYNNELIQLKNWYDNYYTQHEQKYRRLHSLGKLTDEGKDPYNELINLYNMAEIKRARIQELERLLSDNSK